MWGTALLVISSFLVLQTADAKSLTSKKSGGSPIVRAWVPYSQNRNKFPQCCTKKDGNRCHMARISQEVLDAVRKTKKDVFTSSSGNKVALRWNKKTVFGDYEKANGDVYRVVSPSNKDLKNPACRKTGMPASQVKLYFKLVPRGNNKQTKFRSGDSGSGSSSGSTGATSAPATWGAWGECSGTAGSRSRSRSCSGSCSGDSTQTCMYPSWSTWTDCKQTGEQTSSRNPDCSTATTAGAFCEGDNDITRSCTQPGVAGNWEAWSSCEFGVRERSKTCAIADDADPNDTRLPSCEGVDLGTTIEQCTAALLSCLHSGEVSSVGYPSTPYTAGLLDIYHISATDNQVIDVEFTNMDLENTPNCEYDYVEIRDKNTGDVVLGRTCGTDRRKFRTTSTELEILFHTDDSVEKSGWKLKWCAPQLVTSPNYPSEYPNDVITTKKIAVGDNKRIRFEFLKMDIELSNGCVYDYVHIYNEDKTEILPKTCGTGIPIDDNGEKYFYSTGPYAYVEFKSDSDVKKTGFELNWVEVEAEPEARGHIQ